MSRMSDCAQDLESIHNILLGQRQVAVNNMAHSNGVGEYNHWQARVVCINDLLLEFEAAGVVWPGNVVSLEERITAHVGPPKGCNCGGDIHPSCGPNC